MAWDVVGRGAEVRPPDGGLFRGRRNAGCQGMSCGRACQIRVGACSSARLHQNICPGSPSSKTARLHLAATSAFVVNPSPSSPLILPIILVGSSFCVSLDFRLPSLWLALSNNCILYRIHPFNYPFPILPDKKHISRISC